MAQFQLPVEKKIVFMHHEREYERRLLNRVQMYVHTVIRNNTGANTFLKSPQPHCVYQVYIDNNI